MKNKEKLLNIFAVLYVTGFFFLMEFLRHNDIIKSLFIVQGVFLMYFVLVYLRKHIGRKLLIMLFVAGVAARIFMSVPLPESLSDDVYRYLWDGKVQAASINPYSYAPSARELMELRDTRIYPKINNKTLKTIYPPLAQLFFRFAYKAGGSNLIVLRSIYFLFDLMMLYVMYLILGNWRDSAVYWLCPLIIIETYTGMHLDIVGVLILTISIYLLRKNKYAGAFIMLYLAAFFKYIALILMPVYLIHMYKKRKEYDLSIKKIYPAVLILVFATLCMLLPYYKAGGNIIESFIVYSKNWYFNSFILYLANQVFPEHARIILTVILGISIITICSVKHLSVEKRAFYSMASVMLLSHTLYPWYLIWLVPFLVLYSYRSFMLLTMLIFLSYSVLVSYRTDSIWEVKTSILLIQYLPFYIVLMFGALFPGIKTRLYKRLEAGAVSNV